MPSASSTVTPSFVLAQPDHFAAAPDLGAEFGGALGQQALGDGLRDAEDVRVRGVQPVRPRLGDAGEETADRELLAEREEPLQQAALVHHLDAARVQAERADCSVGSASFSSTSTSHAVQPQLAGQHQAGRSAAGNDHVNHESSHSTRLNFGPRPRGGAHPCLRAERTEHSHRRCDVLRDPYIAKTQAYFANP